tara:strand:+ start:6658 stop:7338 length:681 start_codon:yes stop_codon:yes gene_type:complete
MIPVITIDGPGGTGKGSLSLRLKRMLGWFMLDSGALYRALAFSVSERDVSSQDEKGLLEVARSINVEFLDDGLQSSVLLNGQDISNLIRTEDIGTLASKLAASASIRAVLLQKQRDFLKSPGLIADGRDMGTTVFPDAALKIFLTASIEERSLRRLKQLKEKGITARLARLSQEIAERDNRDSKREESPMRPAKDAEILDTTGLGLDEVVSLAEKLIETRFGKLQH